MKRKEFSMLTEQRIRDAQRSNESYSTSPALSDIRRNMRENENINKKNKSSKTTTNKSASIKVVKTQQNLKHYLPYDRDIATCVDDDGIYPSNLAQSKTSHDEENEREVTFSNETISNDEQKLSISELEVVQVGKDGLTEYVHDSEDDFEDYEPDFDSYSESNKTESEEDQSKKINIANVQYKEAVITRDANSYVINELNQMKNHFDMIQEATKKENMQIQESKRILNYELQKKGKQVTADYMGSFIGIHNTNISRKFSKLKDKWREEEIFQSYKSRGANLLQMVNLDIMQYTLYEVMAIPYDQFMRFYVRRSISQIHSQTKEENTSSECQSKEIYSHSKWTQHPIELRIYSHVFDNEANLREAISGVGEGDGNKNDTISQISAVNTRAMSEKLNHFMKIVGKEMLALLENEYATSSSETSKVEKLPTLIDVSTTLLKYDAISYLQDRSITMIIIDSRSQFCILTVHKEPCIGGNENSSIICIWNTHQSFEPRMILKSWEKVTTCCFVAEDSSFIVAGHVDGSLCVWDLRESIMYCQKLRISNVGIEIRSPSFTTVQIPIISHNSSVVKMDSVKSNISPERIQIQTLNDIKIETIFSMDEENYLFVWNLSRIASKTNSVGSAPWSKINFFLNQIIDTKTIFPKYLAFNVTTLTTLSHDEILLGTSIGFILRFNSCYKSHKVYAKEQCMMVTCVEVCPHNEKYFAAGYGNGELQIYNCYYSQPISNLGKRDTALDSIKSLQWVWKGHMQNLVISLDSHLKFCIYNFSFHDCSLVFVHSIKIEEDITSATLFPCDKNIENSSVYVAFSTSNNYVKIQRFTFFHE